MFRTLTPCDRYTVVVCPMGIILSVESLRHATEGGCTHSFVCHGALTSDGGHERTDLVLKCIIIRGHILSSTLCPRTRYSKYE
jgi:hypothetical protein